MPGKTEEQIISDDKPRAEWNYRLNAPQAPSIHLNRLLRDVVHHTAGDNVVRPYVTLPYQTYTVL